MILLISGVPAVGDNADGVVSWVYDNNITDTFSYDYNFRRDGSVVKAHRPNILAKKLLDNISGNVPHSLQTNLLDNYQHLVVTSGDALRRLKDAVIKTSFQDCFKSYNAILCASFSISGTHSFFERRDFVYNSASISLNTGETSGFEWEWAKELFFNLIKVGYPSQDYGALNGKLEFNTTAQFSVPAATKKTYEIVSVYRGDPYGATYTWLNLEGKTTTDSNNDNDVFILNTIDQQQLAATSYVIYYDGPTRTHKLQGQAGEIALFPIGKAFKAIYPTPGASPFDDFLFYG